MKDNLMQKMFGVFESIIKSEGATALTNERIKKCCEENDVDYAKFSASVIEEVLSVIGAHSGNSGDVFLSELSSNDLETVSGGMGTFRRGTASALAALNLCGATQLPASAGTHTASQVVPEKVASRHLNKRSGDARIITSQSAPTLAKYLSTAALGSFLTLLLVHPSSGTTTTNPTQKQNLAALGLVNVTHVKGNGFLLENTDLPVKDCVYTSGRKVTVTPYLNKEDGRLFRRAAFFDTLSYCEEHLGFSVTKTKTDNPNYNKNDTWTLPCGHPTPNIIKDSITSVRVTKPLGSQKCATIWLSNGRALQTMVALQTKLGKAFDTRKTAILDFANFFNPGGAPFGGCFAQEESICRITNLYPLLCNKSVKQNFYDPHNARQREYLTTSRGKDLGYWKYVGTFRDCVYVPGVQQIKNDYGASRIGGFINGPTFNIIAAAATDLRQQTGLVDTNRSEYRECFKTLWRQIISTAYTNGNDNLAAGALGCGAFGNDPKVVAETFFDVLMNEGPNQKTKWAELFTNVILPIYIYKLKDATNYAWFLNIATFYKHLSIQFLNLYCPE